MTCIAGTQTRRKMPLLCLLSQLGTWSSPCGLYGLAVIWWLSAGRACGSVAVPFPPESLTLFVCRFSAFPVDARFLSGLCQGLYVLPISFTVWGRNGVYCGSAPAALGRNCPQNGFLSYDLVQFIEEPQEN